MGNSSKKQGSIVAIMAMIFLFAMIAFVTNLCEANLPMVSSTGC